MKKLDIEKYKRTKRGYRVYPMLNKLFIDGIACILCALFLFISTMIMRDSKLFYLYGTIMLVLGIIFIIKSIEYKNKEIYLMKKAEIDKKKKKANIDNE